jgi:hypothetical protein
VTIQFTVELNQGPASRFEMPRKRSKTHTPKQTRRAATAPVVFEPRHPTLIAAACFALWIGLMSLPMLGGAFLATPYNDQYSSGYAYRAWAAEWWKRLGHVPLWNPEIFGGMPFVAGMSGDVLYPTAWLRLVLPTHVAMNLGFVIHYVLAGLFTYWFLRRWRVSWTGAVVGGLAYQLAGVIGSYVSPGHDGKLFVTSMLPLALTGLTIGIRDRRLEGYALVALAVGLIMLSPHPQMAQYALLAAGLFTLYLTLGEGTVVSATARLSALGLAALAVIVGVGVSAIQYVPFYAYIPYSPRDSSVLHNFAWSAAYAIPWAHVPEFVIPRFTGESFSGSYWGPNGLKLHSEYLGLLVVALAAVGAADRSRRRMILWLGGIGFLFLLIALGSATPFFRLWWEVVPFSKSMRAPGMALFIVAFVTAVLAAFGVDRVTTGSVPRFAPVALIVGGLVAMLGLTGAFGAMAESLGRGVEASLGFPNRGAMAATAAHTLQWSAPAAGLALAAAGALASLRRRGLAGPRVIAGALIALVGTDLWFNARAFWNYSNAPDELFAGDAIKTRLRSVPRPFRVWDLEVYPGAALMADDIAQLYGHHGNEPHAFDVVNAREGESLSFARAGDPQILDLFAVNYLIVQATATTPDSLPGFRRTLSNVATSSGTTAMLFEREQPIGYARFVPAGAVPASRAQIASTVVDPRFPIDRVVLLDSAPGLRPGAIPSPAPPAPSVTVTFASWQPGEMRMRFGGAGDRAPSAGYLLVSENWDAEWRATVDGQAASVLRGDGTLITVPVAAGAREVSLRYEGRAYSRGRVITLIALVIVVLGLVSPPLIRRRSARPSPAVAPVAA